ncbi:MAG: S9 family peptidase, partial [Pseudomonadota bacterium]
DGSVLGREDMNVKRSQYKILKRDGQGWHTLYEEEAERPPLGLHGVNQAGTHLVVTDRGKGQNFTSLYEISIEDGKWRGPLLQKEGHDIAGLLMDDNRVVYGVEYSGLVPSYGMFDKAVDEDLGRLTLMAPGAAIRLESWSEDWSRLLLYAEGSGHSGRFFSYDRNTKEVTPLASARPQIEKEDVADVVTIEYTSRDGLKIPSILTLPKGVTPETAKNLPTVVLPHGGPEAFDRVGFDWMAQYFASQGYLVMQPNFRGSTGFGWNFIDAGRGEWGKKMQDDVTDGVLALRKMGWSDPSRTCIVGWSYGGYSALAGGAFTPDLYKCVIAGGAVTDLPFLLSTEKRDSRNGSWAYNYWKEVIGDPSKQKKQLQAVSPRYHAAAFKAPVLLIHGKDDTVVEIAQSRRMARALEKADKQVTFIVQNNGDHWMSESETRLEVLKAMGDFLATHLQ